MYINSSPSTGRTMHGFLEDIKSNRTSLFSQFLKTLYKYLWLSPIKSSPDFKASAFITSDIFPICELQFTFISSSFMSSFKGDFALSALIIRAALSREDKTFAVSTLSSISKFFCFSITFL